MPLPTEKLIIWANTDVNLPELAGPNKIKPIDDLINKGWDFKQKPAADEFNYVLNNLGMHVSYLEESKTYTFSGDVTGTATSTGSEDVTFNVSVTDNSHNHISANISDATSLNTPNMVVRRDINGDVAVRHVVGGLTGNADTADKWKTARTLTLTGSVSGSAVIDGSGNISLNTSILSSGVSIVTGYLANGETIPLPSGYTEGQCKWTASPQRWYDNAGEGGYDEWSLVGRMVTSGTDVAAFYYMCIGVK